MADQPDIRASDADRERVAGMLRRHCGEGRLTLDELGDRLGEAYAAQTIGQLSAPDGPLRQLPVLTPPPPVPHVTAERHPDAPVVDAKGRSFPEHLSAYVVTNLLLIGIWALSGFGYFWPGWVLLGWGMGLASHFAATRRAGPA